MARYCMALTLILSGCAAQNPMSELLMFQHKKHAYGMVHEAGYSHAIGSAHVEPYPKSMIESAYGKDIKARNGLAAATHAIFMSDRQNRVAVSLAIGSPFGLDATAALPWRLYATGSAGISVFGDLNGVFVLQRRVADGNPVGLSLGLLAKRTTLWAVDRQDFAFHGRARRMDVLQSVGPRGVMFVGIKPDVPTTDRFFLYANGAYLFDLGLKAWYPSFGLSIGFY